MRWLFATIFVVAPSISVNAQDAPTITLALACSISGGDTFLSATLHRSDSALTREMTSPPANLQIGVFVGPWPSPLMSVATTDLITGATGSYVHSPSGFPAAIGARIDPWMIALPPGTSFSIRFHPSDFLDAKGGKRLAFTDEQEVIARFTIRVKRNVPPSAVSETVVSQTLHVPNDCPTVPLR